MIDYRYQVEAFLYTQAMMPFFSANITYRQYDRVSSTDSFVYIPPYDEIEIDIYSDITQMAMNLSGIKMRVRLVKKQKFGKNRYFDIDLKEVQSQDYTHNLVPQNSPTPIMTHNYYRYTFRDRDTSNSFYASKDLYILLYVSFRHNDGSITPMPRNGQETYLIYRYKVDIPHAPLDTQKRYYPEAKTILEQVYISPDSEEIWNF